MKQWLLFTKKRHQRLIGLILLLTAVSTHAQTLSEPHIKRASEIAVSFPWSSQRRLTQTHPLGLQQLSVEKREHKSSRTLRWINVYQFHYGFSESRLLVVDLNTGKVAESHTIDSVHLPLNLAEIEYAIQILKDEAEVVQLLQADQIRRGQPAFSELGSLDVKASVYEPIQSDDECAQERCALLSLFDESLTVFSYEPIVHLETGLIRLLPQ